MGDNIWSWRKAINQCPELQSTTAHVLLVISCYINDMGTGAYPTIKTIAEDTKLSPKSVITHLQKAREAGFLRVKKHGFGGQKWARNEYFAVYPDEKGGEPRSKTGEIEQKGGEPRSKKAVNLVPKAVNLVPEGGEPNDQKAVKEVHTNIPVNIPVNSARGVELDFATNRIVYFENRKIQFRQNFDEAEFIEINLASREAAAARAARHRFPQPNHWPMVDKYIAMSTIRARAEGLGLINWFTALADRAICEMEISPDDYSHADVDEVICKSGFAQLMTAFEAEQADDAA
ncbi:MAG: helix-turn-helix domain-containing protein [Alphaproteobacteria bacterium]|nr:helix-turn-helix domain-containing protein [Alphaproteobacteria bacterium]